MIIYLAGAIAGCSDKEAYDWRRLASFRLRQAGHTVRNPMTRDYRSVEVWTNLTVAQCVEGDLIDIQGCDVVLARCERPSWGTAMEIALAHRQGKQVIAWGVTHKSASPWVLYHARCFASLDAALNHLCR
jgi:nucleoside 2-deoxyribosyltransferase